MKGRYQSGGRTNSGQMWNIKTVLILVTALLVLLAVLVLVFDLRGLEPNNTVPAKTAENPAVHPSEEIGTTEENSEELVFGENTYGLYKCGNDYYHFMPIDGEQYLFRQFKRMGVNNLFQLYGLMVGTIVNNEVSIDTIIGTTETDIIGPISIHRGSEDNFIGSWSGGVHGIKLDDKEYPTAQQKSFEIYCNGTEITSDGIYYGEVEIRAVNDLYFPKTVTEADLSSAEKAIKETRIYTLTDRMNVKVNLDFYTDCYVTQYYGCQCVTFGMDTVKFPNNNTVQPVKRNENYIGKVQENLLIAESGDAHYEVSVKPYGLGTFVNNNGTAEDVGYCYLATFDKFYFVLVANEVGQTRKGTSDTSWDWEAEYYYYFDKASVAN